MKSHPYFPRDATIENYLPNTIPVFNILGGFFAALSLLMSCAWSMTSGRKLTLSDRWIFIWFTVCGCIHTFVEGYYVTFASTIAGDGNILAQIWKEYAHSDSRYLTNDATVWSVEALTAYIEGPACFITCYAILNKKHYRHAFQLLISFGQLYGICDCYAPLVVTSIGCVVYYATSVLDGFKDCNPAPQYLFGYFVLMNLPWIIVPASLVFSSVKAMNLAFSTSSQTTKIKSK